MPSSSYTKGLRAQTNYQASLGFRQTDISNFSLQSTLKCPCQGLLCTSRPSKSVCKLEMASDRGRPLARRRGRI